MANTSKRPGGNPGAESNTKVVTEFPPYSASQAQKPVPALMLVQPGKAVKVGGC